MADRDSPSRPGGRKFLFDVNNFDAFDSVGNDEADLPPPPPPTFSEDELAEARTRALEDGKRAGLAEAEASRERFIASLLQSIAQQSAELLGQDQQRACQYETEILLVARTLFARLFPALNAAHGLKEVEAMVASVLADQRQQPELIIEVAPDAVDEIRALAEETLARLHGHGKLTIVAKPHLGPGDCQMHWNDGGAERNAAALAEQMLARLDDLLAERSSLQDNRTDDQGSGT